MELLTNDWRTKTSKVRDGYNVRELTRQRRIFKNRSTFPLPPLRNKPKIAIDDNYFPNRVLFFLPIFTLEYSSWPPVDEMTAARGRLRFLHADSPPINKKYSYVYIYIYRKYYLVLKMRLADNCVGFLGPFVRNTNAGQAILPLLTHSLAISRRRTKGGPDRPAKGSRRVLFPPDNITLYKNSRLHT